MVIILVFLIPSPCHQNTRFADRRRSRASATNFLGCPWVVRRSFEAAIVTVIGGNGNVLPCQKTGWILKDLDGYTVVGP